MCIAKMRAPRSGVVGASNDTMAVVPEQQKELGGDGGEPGRGRTWYAHGERGPRMHRGACLAFDPVCGASVKIGVPEDDRELASTIAAGSTSSPALMRP
jgi:hypothetical protein